MAVTPEIQIEINMVLADFRVNQADLAALLHGNPVRQDLSRRAIRVESAAKVYATGVDGGPNVVTGRLRGSITWRLDADEEGAYVDVGTAVEYAVYVEKGTRFMSARPFLTPALEAAHD